VLPAHAEDSRMMWDAFRTKVRDGGALELHRSRTGARCAALALLAACADVLGIPSDPDLVPSEAVHVDAGGTSADARSEPPVPGSAPAGTSDDGSSADGVLPPGSIGGLDGHSGSVIDADPNPAGPEGGSPQPTPLEPVLPDPAPEGVPDAGLQLDAAVPTPPSCEGVLGRVPVDVIFIIDNSGSMAAETAAFESALPGFVASLENNDTDYRLILLSRQRTEERSASQEASTSVCIAAPVSGLETCPAPAPIAGARFFQYSIKIDSSNSFQRALESFDTPDALGLAPNGWSEWLRGDARQIFIEISDADSSLSARDFAAGLSAKSPARFGADPARPSFVFHSIVGIAQKPGVPDIYGADEPIELDTCGAAGDAPDNAGAIYQALSRATNGLRLPICPSSAIDTRLSAVAVEVVLRSIRACASAN
jgi:hypothetical protein